MTLTVFYFPAQVPGLQVCGTGVNQGLYASQASSLPTGLHPQSSACTEPSRRRSHTHVFWRDDHSSVKIRKGPHPLPLRMQLPQGGLERTPSSFPEDAAPQQNETHTEWEWAHLSIVVNQGLVHPCLWHEPGSRLLLSLICSIQKKLSDWYQLLRLSVSIQAAATRLSTWLLLKSKQTNKQKTIVTLVKIVRKTLGICKTHPIGERHQVQL